jgi:SAM-dependent MidA family methyltransferase
MPTPVAELVAERARRFGPLPYDEVLDLVLYHPEHGFYGRGGGAGRGADFLTSPEVGPLFGKLIADALDGWWVSLGEPEPFVVVEAGAGAGTLARDVLAARPSCAAALRYVLVERSEVLRARQVGRLPLEPARQVLGPVVHGSDPEEGAHAVPGIGPLATALAEMPSGPFTGVVLANELLDNLPFRLLERRAGWSEVRVGAQLGEVLVPTAPETARRAEALAPEAPEGGRIPLQEGAGDWLRSAVNALERGVVVAIDYADTTPSMARRPWMDWIRTYRGHGRGAHPLERLGEQDVTCEVAVDQLDAVHAIAGDRSQAEFLFDLGMASTVAEARRNWEERAHIGDLEALKHRGRLTEADALTDTDGLGAFRVLQWNVGG